MRYTLLTEKWWMTLPVVLLGSCGLLLAAGCSVRAETELGRRDALRTVVLANRNVPESAALAQFYMKMRGVPTNHLCLLDLPAGETISRRVFERKLRDPLLAFLRQQNLIEQVREAEAEPGRHDSGWRTVRHQITYLVSLYGVPLRVAETRPYLLDKMSRLLEQPFQRDTAAVDSELACLLWDRYELMGFQPNPHYNMVVWAQHERAPRPVLIAARLDGPQPEDVRRMMEDSLVAEQAGLLGRVYVDARSIGDPDYVLGDYWLFEAAERCRRMGFDVSVDRESRLFPDDYPMESAALYLGWYGEHVYGPFRQPDFRFRPGAVAYHLHSASAKSLRTRDRYWAGPLIAAGAAAVMGAVNEPFLSYTPDLQLFTDRLLTGYSFGESAYLAQRALSWQITVVGDPLYRPFAYALEERIKKLEADNNPDVVWLIMRRVNLLADQQQFNPALAYLRQALKRHNHWLLREQLADLYAKNELWNEAIAEYRNAMLAAPEARSAIRIGHRLILILRLLQRVTEAEQVEQKLREAWPESIHLPYLNEARP